MVRGKVTRFVPGTFEPEPHARHSQKGGMQVLSVTDRPQPKNGCAPVSADHLIGVDSISSGVTRQGGTEWVPHFSENG